MIAAVVDPDLRARGQASFEVPPNTPGLSQGQNLAKHGIRASLAAEVVLDNCWLPGSCLLGGKEKLDERLAVGARAVGIARAAYDYALDYAKERVQFGRPIIESQSIAFMLADMKTSIDASRLLVWRAAWMAKQGKKFEAAEGSMSELFAGETAIKVTGGAMHIR